jgi:hypothetical protein
MTSPIEDSKWVKSSFMIPSHAADQMAAQRSRLSGAYSKFTDTTLGGNFAINPPPQFTRTADLKVNVRGGRSKGMGRKYSEAIDDNGQLIHMRFGLPQFNSLMTFFTGFYDSGASILSRTGRSPGFFYNLGRVSGFVVTLPLLPLIMAGRVYRYLARKPSSKFYYLKPAMPLYWSAVNSIANGIAVNMGIIPRVFASDKNQATATRPDDAAEGEEYNSGAIVDQNDGATYGPDDIAAYHNLLPDIYHEGGGIDVYAVASRAQRLADRAREKLNDVIAKTETVGDLQGNMIDHINEVTTMKVPAHQFEAIPGVDPGAQTYLAHWMDQAPGTPKEGSTAGDSMEKGIFDKPEENASWFSSFIEFAEAEIRDGSQFATFRVNHTGDIGESFSNSAGESQIASKINGMSSGARSGRFSFADGNISDGAVGALVGGVLNSAKEFVGGVGESLGVSGLGALMGNAFVDIPQVWQNSTADLPKSTYTMHLRTPYGNKMSRFMNLYVPLSMILAGALPKSTGKHSYDSPFLVEIFDKGRQQVRLGVIDSLQITRGVGNVGWTRNQEPLGIDVTFSVLDLSSILHMPMNASPGIFDEDNAYTDYLAVLGSLSLADQFYAGSRLRLSLTRKMASWRQWSSPAKYGMWAANTIPGQMLNAFAREASR